MANDVITHLDDEPVQGLTLNQAVEKMRGPENSNNSRSCRKGQDKPIEISITRARIQVRSVRSRLEGDPPRCPLPRRKPNVGNDE
jgi:carboxyl-terminal processing protease